LAKLPCELTLKRETMLASLLPFVKQGNPVAIALLINHTLRPHGVRAHVRRRENVLHILLEADVPPTPHQAIPFIGNGLSLFTIEPIYWVRIYGRRQGDRWPQWQKTVQLKPLKGGSSVLEAAQSSQTIVPQDTVGDSAENQMVSSVSFEPTVIELEGVRATSADLLEHKDMAHPELAQGTELEAGAIVPTLATPPAPSEMADVLKRPEAVILLIFCSLVLFWDTYLSVVEDTEPSTYLSSGQLARRLNSSRRAIRSMKRQDTFSDWSRRRDPEGIAWVYQRGFYVPKV
jgi:hypothetical protein